MLPWGIVVVVTININICEFVTKYNRTKHPPISSTTRSKNKCFSQQSLKRVHSKKLAPIGCFAPRTTLLYKIKIDLI